MVKGRITYASSRVHRTFTSSVAGLCAGNGIGAPHVTLAALAELHQLLTERGFRRSSRNDPTIVRGKRPAAPGTGSLLTRRWRRQSRANPSPKARNSLLAGKIQGILFVWASEGGHWFGMQGQIQ